MFGITRAPELDHPELRWFNTAGPLSLGELRGRLVILDFWTFCCINCLQAQPTLRLIEEAFADQVVVIGVHSPKFPHERSDAALSKALARYDIRHPVIHDPQSVLWEEYCVRAWPSLVFISPDGMVIGQMTGEPDPEMVMHGIGSMLQHFQSEGNLCPAPLAPFPPPPPRKARLSFPGKIKPCPSADGRRLWAIADSGHHQILLADDDGREVARWGSGEAGFEDGSAGARFNGPEGLVCDHDSIYVADTRNHAVRQIHRASGQVITLAGDGIRGAALREERPALTTSLASPWDLALRGDRLLFANAGSHQIGWLDISNSTVGQLAGQGGEDLVDGTAKTALMAQPSGLALCSRQRFLYVADSETSAIRRIDLENGGQVETIIGTGLFHFGETNGPCAAASLQHPMGLCLAEEILWVADSYNGAIRSIDLGRRQVARLPPLGCSDSLCLPWDEPAGLWADGAHRLLLSDTNNHRIVEIRLDLGQSRTWMH
ncbi:MAG: redoxin domain-containing protein [Magnetospirillum sp.]|nr:redoxin domain-containing protein [Magnetospirillum sp.]